LKYGLQTFLAHPHMPADQGGSSAVSELGMGVHGGMVVAEGTPAQIKKSSQSLTGQYLSGKKRISMPKSRFKLDKTKQLVIKGARGNNLKNVTLELPVGGMICITGVSGSGKSTLLRNILWHLA